MRYSYSPYINQIFPVGTSDQNRRKYPKQAVIVKKSIDFTINICIYNDPPGERKFTHEIDLESNDTRSRGKKTFFEEVYHPFQW